MTAPWPAEKTAEMHRLAGEGLSASKIAAKLGVTKNAIIGKMNRGGSTLVRKVSPKAAPVVLAASPAPVLGPCTITDLTDYRCRWPIGDPMFEIFKYCGAAKVVGGPYCIKCGALAYHRPTGSKSVSVANFKGKLRLSREGNACQI